jgi:putative membrane protein
VTHRGGSPDDPRAEVLDVVAAAERTALAWERTGFGMVGVGALLVHDGRSRVAAAPLVLGIVVMVLGAATSVVVAPRRYRGISEELRAGRPPRPPRSPPLLAAAVVQMAVGAGAQLQPKAPRG